MKLKSPKQFYILEHAVISSAFSVIMKHLSSMDFSGETEEKLALGLLLSNTKFQILLIALFTALLTWPCHSIFIYLGGYLSNTKSQQL